MNEVLSEKEYQKYILKILKEQNSYLIRKSTKHYDRLNALDEEYFSSF